MAGALEAVNGHEIDAELGGRLCVPDGGALVEDDDTSSLELLNDRAGAVTCRLDNVDALLNDDPCVRSIVRWDHSWEEGDVDAEWLARQLPGLADLFSQVFGGGLCEGGKL